VTDLHAAIAQRVDDWRARGYDDERFPAIAEILGYAIEGETTNSLRYLRAAQLRALETYWHLRLKEGTPHIAELYRRLFPGAERLDALGLNGETFLREALESGGIDGLIERIRTDDAFAKAHHLDALRETLALDYPSYILALAMGAGKTVLIGAIIATEFAMALEYPDADPPFIENALVFAPGLTILESLRELSRIPFHLILPPRLCEPFASSLKLIYTRDGETGIAVIPGSRFNLVVTNTEKIRIQAKPVRRARVGAPLATLFDRSDEERREVANLRLQAIASLPHLGIFSDEAHHTYGRALGTDLKRVRQTVDYLAAETNVIAVVNTTGTPYFERQPLRDVVVWYGLSQGIADGILKEVANNIRSYAFDPAQADEFVADVTRDFLADYGDHALPDGSPAKLAMYFPSVDDLRELRQHVELAVVAAGHDPSIVIECTNASGPDEREAFNRLRFPDSPHRIVLLVNMGTEGWDCPNLFATALARRLRTSNNFVLQAASRCLRQVPGNDRSARIYLSEANRTALDNQLKETYGESLAQLDRRARATKQRTIRIRKTHVPTIRLRMPRRTVARLAAPTTPLRFEPPTDATAGAVTVRWLEIGLSAASRRVLSQVGDGIALEASVDTLDRYAAAAALAANHRADQWLVVDALRAAYGKEDVPVPHLPALSAQLEAWQGEYATVDGEEERELAIIRPDGFQRTTGDDGEEFSATISYPVDRETLVWDVDRVGENPGAYGFHYEPYNFDSTPEADFYERILRQLNLHRDDVQDVYFTGAITDPRKTDLSFSYLGLDGREHRYTPDFVIHARGDRWMLVEVKMTARREDPIEGRTGRKAARLQDLEARNPGRLVYRIVFSDALTPAPDLAATERFITGGP
jgi:type III restriction enzyme